MSDCFVRHTRRRLIIKKKSGWNVLLSSTSNHSLSFLLEQCLGIWLHVTSLCECHVGTDSLESRWTYCFIWCTDMAKAFKPTRGLNAFALQYVNSQCQHDSLPLKLPAKLHLLAEPTKSPTDYFNFSFQFVDCVSWILFHQCRFTVSCLSRQAEGRA